MRTMKVLKQYGGLALILIGAILLVGCFVAKCESNTELLIGLALIVLGFILHVWQQKRNEKY